MADGITVQLIGAAEVERILTDIPKRQGDKALRKGMRAGAKLVTRRAKARIQSDYETHEKNQLGPAVKTRSAKRSRKFIGAVTTLGEKFFKGDTFYGAFGEFGHFAGKRRGGGARKFVEGKHPMENAAEEVGQRAGRTATRVALAELQKQVRATRRV